MSTGHINAHYERVVAPSGAVYVNLVLTYTRPDSREFSLKLDPALAGDLIEAVQAVKAAALVARQDAIAETAVHKAKIARAALEEQVK